TVGRPECSSEQANASVAECGGGRSSGHGECGGTRSSATGAELRAIRLFPPCASRLCCRGRRSGGDQSAWFPLIRTRRTWTARLRLPPEARRGLLQRPAGTCRV